MCLSPFRRESKLASKPDTTIPFATQTTCSSHYKFTGYERDTETGLDYAYARYYSSRLGRFMSADPMGLGSADPTDPQTMNAYAYVRNSPTSLVDPLGMMISLQQEQGWCDVVDCNFQNEIDAGAGGSISDISFFGGSAEVSDVTYFETYFPTPFGECWGMDGGGDVAPCWYWNSQAGSAGSSQSGGGPTAPQKPSRAVCAANLADKYSIAGAAGTIGKTGFFANVFNGVAGNTISGLTLAVSGGGNKYRLGTSIVNAPSPVGFGVTAGAASSTAEFVGGELVGKVAGGVVTFGKLGYDVASFGVAYYKCGKQQ
jgi:RHS repeat-associated protein